MMVPGGGSGTGSTTAITLVIVSLFLSAFFSGSETGYMSVSRVRLRSRRKDETPVGRRLLRQLRRIEDPILTCLIGTNLSNVVLSALVTMLLTERYGERGEWMSVLVAGTAVILFGEILPKVLFREYAEGLTLISTPVVAVAMFALAPVRWVLNRYTDLLRRTLPDSGAETGGGLDRRSLAALLLSNSLPTGQDRRFTLAMNKYLDLASRRLGGVMRPFESIRTIESGTTVGECLAIARESGYSRLPILAADAGRLEGYVLVRDLLFLSREKHGEPVPRHLWRRLLLVDGRMSPYGLFEEMRNQERQLAVVVDPQGNPEGLITLEDLIEAVFGSLRDEFDFHETRVRPARGAFAGGKESG